MAACSIIGNRFEDAAWVNAGYGTSIDVVCAENKVVRSALLLNFGVTADGWFEPSWYVQYFDNEISEGQTGIESNGGNHNSQRLQGAADALVGPPPPGSHGRQRRQHQDCRKYPRRDRRRLHR